MSAKSKGKYESIKDIPRDIKIGLVISDYHKQYTSQIEEFNVNYLKEQWFKDIEVFHLPWSFEIPSFVSELVDTEDYDLIIPIWVIIKLNLPHYDYICAEIFRWLMDISIDDETPIIPWIIVCDNEKQVKKLLNENYAEYWLNFLKEILRTFD